MIQESLYYKYIRRRGDFKVLEDKDSFIIYKFSKDECYIRDIYIEKTCRGTGKLREIINTLIQIAKSNNCKVITGNIFVVDPGHNKTLVAAFGLGFKIRSAHDDSIIIAKELGE